MKTLWKNYRKVIIDVIARALRTIAQTAVGTISGCALCAEVNWRVVLSASALAGLCSLLMSVDRITSAVIDRGPADVSAQTNAPP